MHRARRTKHKVKHKLFAESGVARPTGRRNGAQLHGHTAAPPPSPWKCASLVAQRRVCAVELGLRKVEATSPWHGICLQPKLSSAKVRAAHHYTVTPLERGAERQGAKESEIASFPPPPNPQPPRSTEHCRLDPTCTPTTCSRRALDQLQRSSFLQPFFLFHPSVNSFFFSFVWLVLVLGKEGKNNHTKAASLLRRFRHTHAPTHTRKQISRHTTHTHNHVRRARHGGSVAREESAR